MSKLLVSLAVFLPLLLLLTSHVDADVRGTLTSAGGHECDWREKSRSKDKRDLRLDCKCKDKEGNNIMYTCYYVSYYEQCCQNKAKSNSHYHGHVPAYYSQAADQLKALSYPCRGGTNIKIALCNGNNFKWQFSKFGEDDSDSSCTTEATPTACGVISAEYTGACSGADSDTCPSTLQALINAWILLSLQK